MKIEKKCSRESASEKYGIQIKILEGLYLQFSYNGYFCRRRDATAAVHSQKLKILARRTPEGA
jgi:hypothetical protein